MTGFFVANVLWGCDSERSRLLRDNYPSYSEGIRRSIDGGTIMRGMNQDQVYLALGSPVCKTEIQDQGRPVQVWLYPPIGRDACITADFRVYFENGVVTTWDRFTVPTRYTDPSGDAPQWRAQ
jgi:outer membrane protein assembly factor BamE